MLRALTVTWADAEGLLDRAVGMLRRRQVVVKSLAVGPAARDGWTRLTVLYEGDAATAERLVQLYRNVVGVMDVDSVPAERVFTRELALLTLAPAPEQRAECLDALALFGATVLEDEGDHIAAEISGDATFVLSCLRAVEQFNIRDVSRTGAAALVRAGDR